jgi:hypothetical protein
MPVESPRIRPLPGLVPILLINTVYDRTVGLFGSPGQWLRSSMGRTLLGIIGLTLGLASVAWLVLGMMSWTW